MNKRALIFETNKRYNIGDFVTVDKEIYEGPVIIEDDSAINIEANLFEGGWVESKLNYLNKRNDYSVYFDDNDAFYSGKYLVEYADTNDIIIVSDYYGGFDVATEEVQEDFYYLPEEKEEDTMFESLKENNNYRFSINGIAVRGLGDVFYTYDAKEKVLKEVKGGFLDKLNEFLFKMPTTEVEVGDIIIHSHLPYYITRVDGKTIKGVNYCDATEVTIIPNETMYGQSYFIKIYNALGTNNILDFEINKSPVMSYMLMGNDNKDISKTLMLQAMQKDGAEGFASNPMMLMALMGKEGDSDMSEFLKMQMLANMNKKESKKEKAE